jgi:Protein of unknown function (DUF3574)
VQLLGGGLLRFARNDSSKELSLRGAERRRNPHPVSLRHAILLGSFFLLLAGCAVPGEALPPSACLLPAQKPMLVAELFFGRNIPGRAPVSEAEWADFVAQVITPNFPDGFTVFNGALGQSRDPQSGAIVREPPKILLAAAYPGPTSRTGSPQQSRPTAPATRKNRSGS